MCASPSQQCGSVIDVCANTVLPQFLAGLLTPFFVAILAVAGWWFYTRSQDTGQLFKEEVNEH